MEKKNPHQLQITLVVLGVHMVISFIMLLIYGSGIPLFGYIVPLPLWMQVLVTSIIVFAVYGLAGYLLGISSPNTEKIVESIDKAVLTLMAILLIAFVIIFAITYFTNNSSLWLIYNVLNPMFGNVMIDGMTRSLWSLLWIVSAFVPGIGIVFGLSIRMRQEGIDFR